MTEKIQMTSKHFVVIADILANVIVANDDINNKKSLVDLFIEGLEKTNPKFNKSIFLNAVYKNIESLLLTKQS